MGPAPITADDIPPNVWKWLASQGIPRERVFVLAIRAGRYPIFWDVTFIVSGHTAGPIVEHGFTVEDLTICVP